MPLPRGNLLILDLGAGPGSEDPGREGAADEGPIAAPNSPARALADEHFSLEDPSVSPKASADNADARHVPAKLVMNGKDVEADLIRRLIRHERAVQRKWEKVKQSLSERDTGEDRLLRSLKAALAANHSRVMNLFRKWDADGSGTVSMDEFLRGMRLLSFNVTVGDVKLLFKQLDKDGSGSVDFAELDRAIKATGLALDSAIGMPSYSGSQGYSLRSAAQFDGHKSAIRLDTPSKSTADESVAVQLRIRRALQANFAKVVTLFQAWDEDGDGVISRREFWHALSLIGVGKNREDIDRLFSEFDVDGSGHIDFHELNAQLRVGDVEASSRSLREQVLRGARTRAHGAGRGAAQRGAARGLSSARTRSPCRARARARGADCKQSQLGQLPPLARADLGARHPPDVIEQQLSEDELKAFFLQMLEQQRQLEDYAREERERGGLGAEDTEATRELTGVHAGSAALPAGGGGGHGSADASGLQPLGYMPIPDTLLESLSARGSRFGSSPPARLQPVSSGRAVSPQRQVLGAGGGVRMELLPTTPAAGAPGQLGIGLSAASLVSTASRLSESPQRVSTQPGWALSHSSALDRSTSQPLRLGRKATYRSRVLEPVLLPPRLAQRTLRPAEVRARARSRPRTRRARLWPSRASACAFRTPRARRRTRSSTCSSGMTAGARRGRARARRARRSSRASPRPAASRRSGRAAGGGRAGRCRQRNCTTVRSV